MKYFILLTVLFATTLCTAQEKGSVAGKITDKEMNDEALPFANIYIKGSVTGTTTDIDGLFEIADLDPGTYTLVISFVGYETLEIPGIEVVANRVTQVNTGLGASNVTLDEVVVETVRRRNTETAIMMEVQEAKQVVSAISAEQMARGADNNAAEAIQRVPGVTVVDGKFVMIRGLNERYNNVLINNSIAPSTEVDKRTFSFDLLPTDAIDKMVIYKTASADKAGDFSGGIIKITTSDSFSDFNKVHVGFGYRTNTTFQDYYQTRGSKTDILGFDQSYRALPRVYPSREQINDVGSFPGVNTAAARLLRNNFNPSEGTAFYDSSMGFSMGRNKTFENGMVLSFINSINYSSSYQTYARRFNRYTSLNEGETRPPLWLDYNDDTYMHEVRISALSNWKLMLNPNHTIRFKNLFNQIGENETIIRNGRNILQRGDDLFRNYLLGYRARSIYIGQFEGEHKLGDKNTVDWVLGGNFIYESEPDLRRFRTVQPANSPDAPYEMIDPPSANLFDTGRYFGELNEFSFNHGLNYTHTIERVKDDEEIGSIILKSGYYFDYRKREFDARYFSYLLPGNITGDRRNEIKQLPLDEIFNHINVNPNDGWRFQEGTRPVDSYDASNFLAAGYVYAEVPVSRFDISGGLRIEHNVLKLDSNTDTEVIKVDNPITSLLPSLNVGYNISERSILRLAYGKTVNRQEFREIAPFIYYDFKNDVARVGNDDLKSATIDNIDLRYEFYPKRGETMSIGGFYKHFKNPIEVVTENTTEQPQFRYDNASKAYTYGVEVEIRKSFRDISSVPFFSRLSTNLNASYIVSSVDLGEEVRFQARKRDLQGQSPYIVNAALGYDDEKGLSANIIYNRFGNRIFSVGDANFPTIYELSRDHIDLTLSKKFNRTTYKLGIQDLLNAKYRFYEDSNRDEKIRSKNDNPVSVFRRGTLFSLNVTYNF